MAGRKSDFTLTKLDDLFSTQEQRDEEKLSKIRDIPLTEIDDFPDHPFKVRDDEDMAQLIESIKERGVITPATVRQKEDGRYELISGHRRKRACELAGFDTLRCEVVDLNRDEATILMVESNYQRSQILPSEKAYAYKMRLEAMKRQAGRPSKENGVPVGHDSLVGKSRELLAAEGQDSNTQIQRYIRLTNLVPELLEYVDEGRIKMRPAVELSFLDEDSQRDVVDEIDLNDATPSHDQTIRMRKFFEEGKLTTEAIQAIMSEEKPNQREKIVLRGDRVRQLIPKNIPISQTEDFVCKAFATQILIWETIVGERDANFNHVSTGGYNAVLECVSSAHPLRSKILSYYNSMVTSVQNHTKMPSFCTRTSGSAKVNELEWNGSKYVATLTDTNGVLGNYNFSANIDGVSFSVSGNKLTVSMEKAPSKEFTIIAAKKNGVRRGVVVWSDGIHQNGNGIQDVVTYAQEVSDPVSGFVKMKVSYGSCQIVKTSEDGKVDGIQFTVSGNGFNQTVTTANGGKFQLDNLMPGVYTVTEQSIDKYVPQEVHRVTVVAGQVSKVNFNNVLKRGNLQVIKSSEDNLVEGVTFHLYGTSLAGIAVDEYAVTDKNGVASFNDVLISGTTPYTVEEVDTAIRYVVPANQTAPINWKYVTTRNFTNILKKFSVTVTKSDREEGTPQGDATLAGAVYGIYKGETLVDKYEEYRDRFRATVLSVPRQGAYRF